MRRVILMALMAVVSSNAMARYERVYVNDKDGGFTIYADTATIRKNGSKVRMGNLLDYKVARTSLNGKPYLSAKTQVEYECSAHLSRLIAFSTHSRNMGEGDITSSGANNEQWSPIEPASTGERLWKTACATWNL